MIELLVVVAMIVIAGGIDGARLDAATFTVNTTEDSTDINPGDGVALDGLGRTTVRAAFMEANALAGPDTIVIPAGNYELTHMIAGEDGSAAGDLDVAAETSLTVIGAGSANTIIYGRDEEPSAWYDRILHVLNGASLNISDLAIGEGNVLNGDDFGGCLRIESLASVTMTGCRVYGSDIVGSGGGISLTDAALSMDNCIVEGNLAESDGGGIYVDGGTLSLIRSVVRNNASWNMGGGIYNYAGTVTIDRTLISSNSTLIYGGGMLNWGPPGRTARVDAVNTTFSQNVCTWGDGGGILNGSATAGTAIVNLESCTISFNRTGHPDNPGGGSGGGILNAPSGNCTCNIKNTIVSDNISVHGIPHPDDTYGAFNSLGWNLVMNPAQSTGWGSTDLLNVNPLLQPLANNGGPTLTHALGTGSPAINSGDAAPVVDQREFPRPSGSSDDRGAFEVQ